MVEGSETMALNWDGLRLMGGLSTGQTGEKETTSSLPRAEWGRGVRGPQHQEGAGRRRKAATPAVGAEGSPGKQQEAAGGRVLGRGGERALHVRYVQ